MKAFVIDIARCNGCFNCQVACKDEHCGADWSPIAKPQPLTGQFWMKVTEKVRGQVPVVHVAYYPFLCAHCDDAPCAAVCPADAFKRRDDGLLILDGDACIGCGACIAACPSGAIYANEELGISQKCTGCAHLLDEGWKVPRCVDACATEALKFGEEEELADLIAESEPWPGLAGNKVHVFYRNLPKRFVGVSVIDFEDDEVVIGAHCSMIASDGTVAHQGLTDDFGDYFHDGFEPGVYTLHIEKDGFEPLDLEVDLTEIDVSVGDVGLTWKGGERPVRERSYTPAFTGIRKMHGHKEEAKETGAGRADAVGGEGALAAQAAAELAGADDMFKNLEPGAPAPGMDGSKG